MGALFTDTITIYHRTRVGREDNWTRSIVAGVQWKQKTVRTMSDAGKIAYTQETSITIPSITAGSGLALGPGDVVVPGECAQAITADYTVDDLLKDHDGVTVQTVADNTLRPRLRHWKVTAV